MGESNTRTIKTEHLARVEGHGGITVEVEDGVVKDTKVEIHEGPRLVETLVIGKTPQEDVNIVPRICAICTLSHRMAALRGLEKCLHIDPPKKAKMTRELMHIGEMIESHSLHLYLLALPDLISPGYPSAIAMVDEYGDEVIKGLKIKKFANRIMKLTSDRMVHGENPIIGGFGRYLSPDELKKIKEKAQELLPLAMDGIELLSSLEIPEWPESETLFMCLDPGDGNYGFAGDTVLISNGEERDVEDYKEITNERTVSHSFARRSRYNGRPFTVGAISRILLLGDRLDGEAGKYFNKLYNPRWETNPLFNNHAQMIEIIYCLERIPDLVDEILEMEDPAIASPQSLTGKGTGGVEAPRGILYHHYQIEDGLIADADIITPTAQNLDDMEAHLKIAATNLLETSEDNLETKLDTVARAYDPCISCSAHLVKVKHL